MTGRLNRKSVAQCTLPNWYTADTCLAVNIVLRLLFYTDVLSIKLILHKNIYIKYDIELNYVLRSYLIHHRC